MSSTADTIHELGFSDEAVSRCIERKGLLSIELEFTRRCNLRCIYCYADSGEPVSDELSLDELQSIILQAKHLGAEKIVLLGGGEPLVYQELPEVIRFIHSLGLQQFLFTNGTLIDRDYACFLREHGVSVVIKSNSWKSNVQDLLAGVPGSSVKIRRGLELLMDAGYPFRDGGMLGIQTVICRQNYEELPEMWRWARTHNVVPYFEILTQQGRAKRHEDLLVPVPELKSLFEQLAAIDEDEFGLAWNSRPTIAAFSCKRHLYSCLINSQGFVQPCTGVDMLVGNVRESALSDILETSHVIKDLRDIYQKIEGACKTCQHNNECYGCRGNAYQITGNYLATDPTCWRLLTPAHEHPAHISQ
jgi:radical SAM protein with 4Fe4S-binding SPASM domain